MRLALQRGALQLAGRCPLGRCHGGLSWLSRRAARVSSAHEFQGSFIGGATSEGKTIGSTREVHVRPKITSTSSCRGRRVFSGKLKMWSADAGLAETLAPWAVNPTVPPLIRCAKRLSPLTPGSKHHHRAASASAVSISSKRDSPINPLSLSLSIIEIINGRMRIANGWYGQSLTWILRSKVPTYDAKIGTPDVSAASSRWCGSSSPVAYARAFVL